MEWQQLKKGANVPWLLLLASNSLKEMNKTISKLEKVEKNLSFLAENTLSLFFHHLALRFLLVFGAL